MESLVLNEYLLKDDTATVEEKLSSISISKKWGMKNSQANQVFYRKANSLVKNLLKEVRKDGRYSQYIKCFEKYFRGVHKSIAGNESCLEAMFKEEVEEKTFSFAKEMASLVGVSEDALNDVWANSY